MTVCDICSKVISFEDGYALTTSQVATSEAYWKYVFSGPWSYLHDNDPSGKSLAALVQNQAGQHTGWLVCGACCMMFLFDRSQAKRYAILQQNPPGSGPAPVELVAISAANVWKRLYGSYPASIQFTGNELTSGQKMAKKLLDAMGHPTIWLKSASKEINGTQETKNTQIEKSKNSEHSAETDKVRIKCPHCGSIWKVKIKFLGKKGRCSKCNNHFISKEIPDEYTTNKNSRKDSLSLEDEENIMSELGIDFEKLEVNPTNSKEDEEIRKNKWIFDEIMLGNYSNYKSLTYITPEVARELAKLEGALILDGLSTLNVAVARELAKHIMDLFLNGLNSLTVEVARELAKRRGKRIYLYGLTSLTVNVARELAKSKGEYLVLNGLRTLNVEVARELAKHKGENLYLDGLTELSVEVAHELAKHEGMFLSLYGLSTLTVEVARELAKYENNLFLDGLTSLTVEVARELAKHKGGIRAKSYIKGEIEKYKPKEEPREIEEKIKKNLWIFDEIKHGNYSNHGKLTFLTPEVARELAKHKGWLFLNGLTSLTVEVARELAINKIVLCLHGLHSVSDEVASELAKYEADLILDGLYTINVAVARELAKHKGEGLSLYGLTSLTKEVACELAKHRGKIDTQPHIEKEINKFKLT